MNKYIDPNLKYCFQCKEEYRPEITHCADCGAELLTGKEIQASLEQEKELKAKRDMNISSEDDLMDVRKGPVRDIKQLQALLKAHLIPSLIIKDNTCGKGCCGTDIILQVRTLDIQEVINVFAQEHESSTGLSDYDTSNAHAVFNTSAVETTCPACGFSFSTQSTICPDCGLFFA